MYSCAAQLGVARALWSCFVHEPTSSPVLESQLFCPFFLSAVLQRGDVWGVLTQLTLAKWQMSIFWLRPEAFPVHLILLDRQEIDDKKKAA